MARVLFEYTLALSSHRYELGVGADSTLSVFTPTVVNFNPGTFGTHFYASMTSLAPRASRKNAMHSCTCTTDFRRWDRPLRDHSLDFSILPIQLALMEITSLVGSIAI